MACSNLKCPQCNARITNIEINKKMQYKCEYCGEISYLNPKLTFIYYVLKLMTLVGIIYFFIEIILGNKELLLIMVVLSMAMFSLIEIYPQIMKKNKKYVFIIDKKENIKKWEKRIEEIEKYENLFIFNALFLISGFVLTTTIITKDIPFKINNTYTKYITVEKENQDIIKSLKNHLKEKITNEYVLEEDDLFKITNNNEIFDIEIYKSQIININKQKKEIKELFNNNHYKIVYPNIYYFDKNTKEYKIIENPKTIDFKNEEMYEIRKNEYIFNSLNKKIKKGTIYIVIKKTIKNNLTIYIVKEVK